MSTRRHPKTSPDSVTVEAVTWDDVIRRTRVSLSEAWKSAYVLSIGAVAYEDDELLILAQELDPEHKNWLRGEWDPVRIKKALIVKRQVVGTITVKLETEEDLDEGETDAENPA